MLLAAIFSLYFEMSFEVACNKISSDLFRSLLVLVESLCTMILFNSIQKWTTDEELANAIQGCGVTDLVNIKFFENRANGQSKG